MSFEVGKRYRQTGTNNLFEPIYVGEKQTFGTMTYNYSDKTCKDEVCRPNQHADAGCYIEIREPRSIESLWFNIFVNMSDPDRIWVSATPFASKAQAQNYAARCMSGTILVDTIEITYTEKLDT
jgi:hypothetical protein